jgi:protein TonB
VAQQEGSTSVSTCRRRRGPERRVRLRRRDGGSGRALALSAGLSDRAPLPLVRVEPQYPPQAARQGLEGWVQVQFTISTAGSIRDAVVVKSSNSVFERAAITAVNKWKYQPQMQEGKPVEASNVRVVVRFRMEG